MAHRTKVSPQTAPIQPASRNEEDSADARSPGERMRQETAHRKETCGEASDGGKTDGSWIAMRSRFKQGEAKKMYMGDTMGGRLVDGTQ